MHDMLWQTLGSPGTQAVFCLSTTTMVGITWALQSCLWVPHRNGAGCMWCCCFSRGFAEAEPAGPSYFVLPRKQPVLLGEPEQAQISLFSISYTWYIPSLLTPGKATARTSPQGRKHSFQSSLGFPRGCQRCALSRCTPSCWAGQYQTGHLQGKEKNFAQLEAAKWCEKKGGKGRKLCSTSLCSPRLSVKCTCASCQQSLISPPVSKNKLVSCQQWYEGRQIYRSESGTSVSQLL